MGLRSFRLSPFKVPFVPLFRLLLSRFPVSADVVSILELFVEVALEPIGPFGVVLDDLLEVVENSRLASTRGSIPKDRKLADFHRPTNDRFLYLQLSSPRELKETPRVFLRKTENKIKAANSELAEISPARYRRQHAGCCRDL